MNKKDDKPRKQWFKVKHQKFQKLWLSLPEGVGGGAISNPFFEPFNVGDSVGIMVYEGTQSLNYVKIFVNGADQWEGFPIKVNVNSKAVMLGCKGSSSSATILKLAEESVKQDLLGVMVWYASVKNGFQYAKSWDASTVEDSKQGYIDAMKYFNNQ